MTAGSEKADRKKRAREAAERLAQQRAELDDWRDRVDELLDDKEKD